MDGRATPTPTSRIVSVRRSIPSGLHRESNQGLNLAPALGISPLFGTSPLQGKEGRHCEDAPALMSNKLAPWVQVNLDKS
jgi:hypothetical protein